jgi:hypothetical protein
MTRKSGTGPLPCPARRAAGGDGSGEALHLTLPAHMLAARWTGPEAQVIQPPSDRQAWVIDEPREPLLYL